MRFTSRFFKRVSKKIGMPPGTLFRIGKKKKSKAKITLIDYDKKRYTEKEIKTVEECFPFKNKPTTTWINIDGLQDIDLIKKIGKYFDIHPLILEDIVTTGQRPKIEDLDTYIFIVLTSLYYNEKTNEVLSEQVSLVVGSNFVISFQENGEDVFEAVKKRIKNSTGRLRSSGSDYLSYVLMDSIVDNYFIILEKIGEDIEEIEQGLVVKPEPKTLQTVYNLKREMIFLRKSVWPLRELISKIERSESPLFKKRTHIYFRDVYDHTIQVIDTVETFRDMTSGMLDLYLSSVSNKLNEVMKILTIFSAVFIPLTFIVGLYGMNFKYMPELEWRWSYFILLGVMASITGVMFIYFRRKGWL